MRQALTGLVFSFLLAVPAGLAYADTQPTGTATPPQATESPSPAAPGPGTQLTEAQLDQLVAPIALYPDELLSDVLMSSSYPIEIVEADRWYDTNKNLTGTALTTALDQQTWHASVKSLVATPTVLDMMSNQLGWTQQLGTAVLTDQAAVMAAVQRLRLKAQAEHQLESNKQQTVSVQTTGEKQAVVIQPATPGTVYVPYYNPAVVYGPWPYPAYLPYYWPPPPGYVVGPGIYFGTGFWIADPAWHGYWGGYWGGFNWSSGNIVIHQTVVYNNNVHVNVNNWQHDQNDQPKNMTNTYHGQEDSFSDTSKQSLEAQLQKTDTSDYGQNPGNDQNKGGQNPGGDQNKGGQNPGGQGQGGDQNKGGQDQGGGQNPSADQNKGGQNPGGQNPSADQNKGGDQNPGADQNKGGDQYHGGQNPGEIGDDHSYDQSDLHGDAFGGWHGERSDYAGGGFRGGAWGGEFRRRR